MSEESGNPTGKSLELILYQIKELFKISSRLENQLEGLETKMDTRLDKLEYVSKETFDRYVTTSDKRFENQFALLMTMMGLMITLVLAFVGYLVVAS